MRDSAEEAVELPTGASHPGQPATRGPGRTRWRKGDPVRDSAEETVELPTGASHPGQPATRGPGRTRSGFWAELSGALAAGLAALAVVVVIVALIAVAQGIPGPGLVPVVGHVAAAGLALFGQRFADRLRGWPGAAAVLAVLAVTGVALWLFWWA